MVCGYMSDRKETPMMRQYNEVRAELPDDALLLFRLGDFYEMFHEDAERGASALGITLTRRHDTPMAGIPYHAAKAYIQKLLDANFKVAICDQVETPKPGKLVERALSRIITPGTILDEDQLDPRSGSYLVALDWDGESLHVAWLDLSAGIFEIASEKDAADVVSCLDALAPTEILIPENLSSRHPPEPLQWLLRQCPVTRIEHEDRETRNPRRRSTRH